MLFIGVKKRLHSLCMTTLPPPPLSSQNTERAKDVGRTKDNRQRIHLTRMFTSMLPSTKTPASKEIKLCPESDAIKHVMDWHTNTLRPRPLADEEKAKEKHRKCSTKLNLFPSRAPAFLFSILAPALATLKKWRGLNSASLKNSYHCTNCVRFHKEGIFF